MGESGPIERLPQVQHYAATPPRHWRKRVSFWKALPTKRNAGPCVGSAGKCADQQSSIHVVDLVLAVFLGRHLNALDVAALALVFFVGVVVTTGVVAVVVRIVMVVADATGFEVVQDETEYFGATADRRHLRHANVAA